MRQVQFWYGVIKSNRLTICAINIKKISTRIIWSPMLDERHSFIKLGAKNARARPKSKSNDAAHNG